MELNNKVKNSNKMNIIYIQCKFEQNDNLPLSSSAEKKADRQS